MLERLMSLFRSANVIFDWDIIYIMKDDGMG